MGQLSNGGRERNKIWHKGSLGMRMMPEFECTHSTEKVHDTTLDDENASQHNIRFSDGAL